MGQENILSRYEALDSFILYCSGKDLKAAKIIKDSNLLVANIFEIHNPQRANCNVRGKILENLVAVLDEQNRRLSKKINICAKNCLRGRILYYLQDQRQVQKSKTLSIPFNRQDLANYLSCNRSALSRELSRMENEKIIKTDKNKIYLLKNK